MTRTDNTNVSGSSLSSQVATIIVAVLAGTLLGLAISYFFQPGLLREFFSFGDYMAQLAKVAGGREEVPQSEQGIYWTAIVCTLAGAGCGYFAGRKIVGPLRLKASGDTMRPL